MSTPEGDQYSETTPLGVLEWVRLGRAQREKLQKTSNEFFHSPTVLVEDVLRCNESGTDFRMRAYLLELAFFQTADELTSIIREGVAPGTDLSASDITFVGGSEKIEFGGTLWSENIIIFVRSGFVTRAQYREGLSRVIKRANEIFVDTGKEQVPQMPLRRR